MKQIITSNEKGCWTKNILVPMVLWTALQLCFLYPGISTTSYYTPFVSQQDLDCPPTTSTGIPKLARLIKPPPRNQTAVICAVAKEEEPYIDEWLDFHLGIGFGPIYLYDNSENHDLEQVSKRRRQDLDDPVFSFHDPGTGRQKSAYARCAKHVHNLKHKWAAFIDIDEFVVIKNRTQFPHIVDLLQEYAASGRFHIWWRNFGSSGNEVYEPIPVTKRFQYLIQKDHRTNHQFKSIVHIPDFDWSKDVESPHWFSVRRGSAQVDTTRRWPDQMKSVGPDDVVALYHYQWKSFGELNRNKRARGDSWYGTNKKFVQTAQKRQTQDGHPLPNGTTWDDTAWQILKSVAPRYSVYDAFDVLSRSDFVPDTYNKTWAIYP
jgi:hypothetical protein